ncbi:MAG TPA: alkaline phosphatase family protein [Gaiellaceae bacterium]|nr:alkaline phosphatase family protein [Gaiellaceae bacterium]
MRVGAAAIGVALCAFLAAHVSHADATACKRLVYIQFDNTSYSDVRQMPTLLNFLTQHGTIYTNDHTVLISHTATGIVSTLTGLYPDRHGLTVSNSYGYFTPSGTTSFTSAFKYWTDPVDPAVNPLPNLITTGKKTTPAPWVPFTRAGCDVGAIGMANIVPENGSSVGVAIHCSLAPTSVCNGNPHATPDLLPDEPGGYDGYKAIFTSQAGITAASSLAAVEQMQESGVPVTFAYLPDAHAAYGPGEAGYVANLKANDDAFSEFFANLSAHGIDSTNTLFVITTDEGDHFAGTSGSSYTHTVCTNLTACPANQMGELDVNLKALLPGAYVIHEDSAPAVYYYGRPVPTDPAVRKLAQDAWALTSYDPYAGKTVQLFAKMADPLEELALHMVNADPSRTPTLTLFGNPDFFFQSSDCNGVHVCANPAFAWNHGDVQDEIARTWLGLVGPGVQHSGIGINFQTWTDHTNVRPTILALLGLKDDYVHDGRVLVEALEPSAIPKAMRGATMRRLAAAYNQLNAPFGTFAAATLGASTTALASPTKYASIEKRLAALITERNKLAVKIRNALDAAAFHGKMVKAAQAQLWTGQSFAVISHALALNLVQR